MIWLEHILDERLLDGQKFRELFLQFGRIKLIVAPRSNNHLCLLLKSEVLPGEAGVDVLLVHLQDLIVADHPGVCKVPDSGEIPLCHLHGNGKELVQDGHGVWNVDHLIIPSNLGDEVSRVLQVR